MWRPLALAVLLIALGVPSNAESEGVTAALPTAAAPLAAAAASDLKVTYYDLGRPFTLNCTEQTGPATYLWSKNGTAVGQVADLNERYKLEQGGAVLRMLGRTNEDDFGNYTCALSTAPDAPLAAWDLRARPIAKMPHNANVVEKQTVKLTCKLIGKPYPAVEWRFTNDTENGTEVTAVLGTRVTIQRSEQGVEGGELVLSDAERSDAGDYMCLPAASGAGVVTNATTTLRVKDQYAALWPFLGICAEMFVLCAIILVYEKRRTKPELDDSDTDNHDQKKS